MPAFLLPLLTGLGSILGGASKGSADQRTSENNQAQQRNQLLAQLYGTQQNATMNSLQAGSSEKLAQGTQDLQQRNFALNAPGTRGAQAVRGSLLQNVQPASFSGLPSRVAANIPQMSGGLTPAALSPEARAMGGQLTRDATIGQLKGDTFDPMKQTDFKSGVLPLPQLEELKKSGLLEQIMGTLGLAGTVAAGVGGAMGSRSAANNYPIDPTGGG